METTWRAAKCLIRDCLRRVSPLFCRASADHIRTLSSPFWHVVSQISPIMTGLASSRKRDLVSRPLAAGLGEGRESLKRHPGRSEKGERRTRAISPVDNYSKTPFRRDNPNSCTLILTLVIASCARSRVFPDSASSGKSRTRPHVLCSSMSLPLTTAPATTVAQFIAVCSA